MAYFVFGYLFSSKMNLTIDMQLATAKFRKFLVCLLDIGLGEIIIYYSSLRMHCAFDGRSFPGYNILYQLLKH